MEVVESNELSDNISCFFVSQVLRIQYSKHKIQNVQGNPALISNISPLFLHKKL